MNNRLQVAGRNPQGGFTLFELVVVIIIVSILAGTLLNRVLYYQELAEKTAMVEVEGAIQSALTIQYGRLMVRGTEAGAAALATDNPMSWLAKKPRNYAGEFYDLTPASAAPGNWAFDLKARELVYVPGRADHLIPGKDGSKWIRYRVNPVLDPVPGASAKNARELVGILFEPVEPYRWFD